MTTVDWLIMTVPLTICACIAIYSRKFVRSVADFMAGGRNAGRFLIAIFPQTKYVQFWWAVTEAIFIGGAGIAVVGGLYWSRGTTAGAWSGLFVGSTLAVTGILADLYCRLGLPEGQEWIVRGIQLSRNHSFILNGVQVSFFAGIAACLSYGIVSLLTCRQPHDMDRLLHRGAYAIKADEPAGFAAPAKKRAAWIHRILGIEEVNPQDDGTVLHGENAEDLTAPLPHGHAPPPPRSGRG